MTGLFEHPRHTSLHDETSMSTTIDKAIFAVPEFGNRISFFITKLRIAQYSEGTITNYCHHIAMAVAYLRKIPDDFLQVDVDDYLSMLINHPRHYSESFFKLTVFDLHDGKYTNKSNNFQINPLDITKKIFSLQISSSIPSNFFRLALFSLNSRT